MAFDRTRPPIEATPGQGPEMEYGHEFGRTYVPLEEVHDFLLLSEREQQALAAWADCLIPGEGRWPSAAQVGAHMYADNCAARSPLLRMLLLRAIEVVERQAQESTAGGFAACGMHERTEILGALESGAEGALFDLVLELVFEGYYCAGPVLEAIEPRTGFQVLAPVEGSALEPFDEALLARVKTLPSAFRELTR